MNPTAENQNPVKRQLISFKFAYNGIRQFISNERNAKIHILAALFVLILGWILSISPVEWCIIIFAIVLVISAEIFNSSIEKLTDKISPEIDQTAGLIKDFAAAAVLVSAIGAFFIGLIIFLPKIIYIV
ncbi:MAG: diacylglycerol kinase family protein [Bacteroidales bacterium]